MNSKVIYHKQDILDFVVKWTVLFPFVPTWAQLLVWGKLKDRIPNDIEIEVRHLKVPEYEGTD